MVLNLWPFHPVCRAHLRSRNLATGGVVAFKNTIVPLPPNFQFLYVRWQSFEQGLGLRVQSHVEPDPTCRAGAQSLGYVCTLDQAPERLALITESGASQVEPLPC